MESTGLGPKEGRGQSGDGRGRREDEEAALPRRQQSSEAERGWDMGGTDDATVI